MKKSLKVLFIEDNLEFIHIVENELRKNYEVSSEIIYSDTEYSNSLRSNKYDVILASLNCSILNCLKAFEIAKKITPRTPFILFSLSTDEDLAVNLMNSGADDYLLKDNIKRLIPAIKSTLEKKYATFEKEEYERIYKDSEEQYRLIMENSMDAILLTIPDGNIISANSAACKMFGMTRDELRQAGRNNILDTSDPRLSSLLKKRELEGKASGILTFIKKDKTKFQGEITSSVFVKSNGDVRTSMLIRDITDRINAEEALKESEEHFRLAIENSPVIVFNQDKDLRYTWIYHPNPSFNEADVIGKRDDELLPIEDAKHLMELKEKVLRKGIVVREKVRTTIGSKVFYYDLTIEPVRNSEGEVTGIACVSVDVTEQVIAENALRERESFIRSVMDNLPIGIAVNTVDPSVKFQYMNDKFAEIYRTKKSLLENENSFWEAVYEDPVLREEMKSRVLKDCASGKPELMHWDDIPIIRKGKKTRYINAMNVPVTNKKMMISLVWDVTYKKRAEDALMYEKYLLHILMDYSPDSIYFKDSKSRFIRINKTQANLFNLKDPTDAVGKTDFDFFLEEHAKKALADEQNIIKTGKPVINKEERETWPNGNITWVSTSKVPLRDKNGKIVGTFGISRNITESKQNEEQLMLLSRAVEQSPVAIVVTDKNAKILYVNTSFTTISGYSTNETIGKNPAILKSGYHSKEFYQKLWSTILSGKEWKGEFYNKRKNGEFYWEAAIISPVVNDEGEITHFVEVKEDISEKKKIEELIKQQNELLQIMFDNIPIMLSRYDSKQDILWLNRQFEEKIGWTTEEAKYVNLMEKCYPDPEYRKMIDNFTISGEPGWKEIIMTTRSGEKLYTLWSNLYLQDFSRIGIGLDISDRKAYEKELIIAKEKAEKSDKLKSEFLAQMSHEIRSPLNVILNFSDLLKVDMDETVSTEFEDYFNGIESAGKRLMRTIDLILNVSELHVGTYEPDFVEFDIMNDIIIKIENEYTMLANSKGLNFKCFSENSSVLVKGDKYSIHQIISNIVDNAFQYTHEGSISIKIDEFKSKLKIEIEDTGIGMSEEFMKIMFEPFIQEHQGYSREFEGNGLGLTLVKGFCKLNNITLNVESEKDKGSKFILIFNN